MDVINFDALVAEGKLLTSLEIDGNTDLVIIGKKVPAIVAGPNYQIFAAPAATLAGVMSITGYNIDNTNPFNPIILPVQVDGVTITGTGVIGDPFVAVLPAVGWSLDGNTNGVLNYIGTNDNFDFPIITNGVEAGRVLASNQYWGIGTPSPSAKLHIQGVDATVANYALKVDNNVGGSLAAIRNDGFVGVGTLTPNGNEKMQVRGQIMSSIFGSSATSTDSPFHAVRKNNGNPNYYSGYQYVFEVGGGVWGISMDYPTNMFQFLSSVGASFGFGGGTPASPANKTLIYTTNGYVGSNTVALYGATGAGLQANFHAVGTNQTAGFWGLRIEDSTGSPILTAANNTAVGVGILTPDSSAILDITSITKGVLFPRMTATQASAITGVDGLIVYVNSTNGTFTSKGFWGYASGAWILL